MGLLWNNPVPPNAVRVPSATGTSWSNGFANHTLSPTCNWKTEWCQLRNDKIVNYVAVFIFCDNIHIYPQLLRHCKHWECVCSEEYLSILATLRCLQLGSCSSLSLHSNKINVMLLIGLEFRLIITLQNITCQSDRNSYYLLVPFSSLFVGLDLLCSHTNINP